MLIEVCEWIKSSDKVVNSDSEMMPLGRLNRVGEDISDNYLTSQRFLKKLGTTKLNSYRKAKLLVEFLTSGKSGSTPENPGERFKRSISENVGRNNLKIGNTFFKCNFWF